MHSLLKRLNSLCLSECLDALAVRRLFVFMKENLNFESLQDELIQRKLLHEKEREDYVCKTMSKHFWIEKLVKLIIKNRRCKEFVAFINDMPCHKHISEKNCRSSGKHSKVIIRYIR